MNRVDVVDLVVALVDVDLDVDLVDVDLVVDLVDVDLDVDLVEVDLEVDLVDVDLVDVMSLSSGCIFIFWPLAPGCIFSFWSPAVPAVSLPGCIWGLPVPWSATGRSLQVI